MLEKVLESLGLSGPEAKVYLAALRTGAARISVIAKRANLSRSTGYHVLKSLSQKGLVRSFDRAKIQYFSPLPPQELLEFLERKKEELDRKTELVKTYLPQFEAIKNPAALLPKVYFFEGVEGVKQVYQDILKKGHKKTLAVLSLDNIAPELKKWIIKIFTTKKTKKKISSQVLISSKAVKSYRKLDRKHLRKSLTLPYQKYPFEVEIDLYDDNKTAFISFDETEMMGVIIESSKIANTLKSLFSLVWDQKSQARQARKKPKFRRR